MRDKNDKQSIIILSVLGIVPVIWLGLCIAPSVHGGLAEIIPALENVINNPFDISLCEDSLKTVLSLLLIYALVICVILSSLRNYRKGEEHGSAKWGDANKVNKKYRQNPENNNKIMTQNVAIGLNNKSTGEISILLFAVAQVQVKPFSMQSLTLCNVTAPLLLQTRRAKFSVIADKC